MIDGLKIQMSTEELECRLRERVLWHEQAAEEYEADWRRPENEREDPLMPEHIIEHEIREHREQAATLEMLQEHLVPNEIYQLTEMDLYDSPTWSLTSTWSTSRLAGRTPAPPGPARCRFSSREG